MDGGYIDAELPGGSLEQMSAARLVRELCKELLTLLGEEAWLEVHLNPKIMTVTADFLMILDLLPGMSEAYRVHSSVL